jgi:cell migration-inducing and hyaluronan-binding protein
VQTHHDASGQTGGERRTLLPIVSSQNRPAPSPGDAQRWSDPATWGGQVPGPATAVVIPAGKMVLFDVDAKVKSLTINGALIFEDVKDLNLSSDWILVNGPRGWLGIGEENKPHTRRATITLTANDPNENVIGEAPMNMGTKFLGAMGGVIEIHGASARKASKTLLNANVAPGATRLTVADATGWAVGDQIVVAPSGFEPREAEVVTITAVSGAEITISPALKYAHWGSLQAYDAKTLDQRAEVALMTRNIIVQGDAASFKGVDPTYGYRRGFGGHGMFMAGSRVRISGALFRDMGQTGMKGRYPLHFHFAADMTGSYVKNSTVRDSFHRAVVVHKTNHVLVEDTVAFNIASHAFVPSEDGDEKFNTFSKNLAMLVRRLAVPDFAFLRNPGSSESIQSEERPGAFWMRNFVGTFRENRIAGVIGGNGYFFDRASGVGQSVDPEPTIFEDNTVHAYGRDQKWLLRIPLDAVGRRSVSRGCRNRAIDDPARPTRLGAPVQQRVWRHQGAQ